jgi:3-polyprenyl-4-hydroxybenzoate decarboxylase
MATWLDAAAGIVTIDKAFAHGLDPSFPGEIGPKLGFDATRPLSKRAEQERVAFESVALETYDIAGLEAKPAAPLPAQPAAAVPPRAAAPEPVRPAAPASDYDTDRIWQRELADWKKTRDATDAAPPPEAKPAAGGARGVSSDWDENRWWKRELEEMQRERAGKTASAALVPKKAVAPAKPSPARPAAPPRPPMPTRSAQAQAAEPRRIEARAGEGRSDDDDGSFFRGGAV